MYKFIFIFVFMMGSQGLKYNLQDIKTDHFVSNMMLNYDLLERLRSELVAENADASYMNSREVPVDDRGSMLDRAMPPEIPFAYETIGYNNPRTSLRDQEYLQHSSLFSYQHLKNKNNFRYHVKPDSTSAAVVAASQDEKLKTQLPAYCSPPNPCPIGYTSEKLCIENFENTAAFSRDYQRVQDCMCDIEHMLVCPISVDVDNNIVSGMPITNADFNQIVDRFQEENPFIRGERLPIAAKKGVNIENFYSQ